jgi:dienelactone hydrolase
MHLFATGFIILVMLGCGLCPASPQDSKVTYYIKPSDTDSDILHFDMNNVVLFTRLTKSQDLLVYLPGTNGKPVAVMTFLEVAANSGFRVISLAYDDKPSVAQACFQDVNPECDEQVRQKRIFGDDVTKNIDDSGSEAIVNRLVKLLQKLQRDHSDQNWGAYLSNGEPNWGRIVISGHSQGGGMAAFIGKQKSVARVVIFSGGWDAQEDDSFGLPLSPTKPAAWLKRSSVTPIANWFAAYHEKEAMAERLALAYQLMGIPSGQIRTIQRAPHKGENFHTSVIRNEENWADWAFLIGRSR